MNAINTAIDSPIGLTSHQTAFVSEPILGADIAVGTGFKAHSFRSGDIGQVMDPLVMVDHYVMTEPTFGAHPHAGLSAVSLLFEDSEGLFHNQDSLGNDFDLQPGDLYWLSAGSGAVHDESPRANSRIHGLQVFVNVPQSQRFQTPTSLLIRSTEMPMINSHDFRVKVVMGESNGVRGAVSQSIPMTILDGTIQSGGRFIHQSAANRGLWIQVVKGNLEIIIDEEVRSLAPHQALAVSTDRSVELKIRNPSSESAHFALFDGSQIDETFVHDGPFVMGSPEQIAEIKAVHNAGQLGAIANNR